MVRQIFRQILELQAKSRVFDVAEGSIKVGNNLELGGWRMYSSSLFLACSASFRTKVDNQYSVYQWLLILNSTDQEACLSREIKESLPTGQLYTSISLSHA